MAVQAERCEGGRSRRDLKWGNWSEVDVFQRASVLCWVITTTSK
jgi:hypothetical protein